MIMCRCHWEDLHKAIVWYGLGHLVCPSEEVLRERVEQCCGSITSDPLFDAMVDICNQASHIAPHIAGIKPNGLEYCPLCEVHIMGGDPREWMEFAAFVQLKLARELNLVPKVH